MTLALASISYNLEGAAAATQIGVTRLKEATEAGDLICHWNGNKRVYRAADLDEWIKNHLPTEKPKR